jgi:hypothetical protein
MVFAAWNGTRRSATMSGPGRDEGPVGPSVADGADPGVTGGRLECMSGRQLARTGGRWRKQPSLGHPAGRQIHPRAERRRKAASEAPVRLTRSSLASAEPLPVCRCPFPTACGMPAWLAGGRESGLLPTRSARSLREARNRKDGLPCGRHEHGAMTRVFFTLPLRATRFIHFVGSSRV